MIIGMWKWGFENPVMVDVLVFGTVIICAVVLIWMARK